MSVNVDLLRRTLAHIEQHPEEWYQAEFRCGTSACFAGHAALLAGAQWADPDDLSDDAVIRPDGEEDYVGDFAASQLGLEDCAYPGSNRTRLFDSYNTLDDLRRIVGELCDGAE